MASLFSAKTVENGQRTRPVSGADFILLVLLVISGFGIWAWVERSLTEILHYREPNEERFMLSRGVPRKQVELVEAQTELVELQKQLASARLEELKQNSAVATIESLYRDLGNNEASSRVPAEVVKLGSDAKMQARIANALVVSLEKRVPEVRAKAIKAADDLEQLKLNARDGFHKANAGYVILKPAITLVVTLVAVLLLVIIVDSIMWRLTRKRIASTPRFKPLLIVMAAVLILLGYQAFELVGAALVAILLLILVLRQINSTAKAEEADVVSE